MHKKIKTHGKIIKHRRIVCILTVIPVANGRLRIMYEVVSSEMQFIFFELFFDMFACVKSSQTV